MKSPGCSVYLCSRVLLGVLDIVSDLVIATHLILEQQVVWGCLVAGWVVLGFLGSLLHVVIRRCRSNIPLTSLKYFLLTLKIHAEHGQAFFHAGPQIITQLSLIFSGVHYHHPQEYIVEPGLGWEWVWPWLGVLSIIISLLSLVTTVSWYNRDSGSSVKVFTGIISYLVSILFRVFTISSIIVISPLLSAAVLPAVFIINLVLLSCFGDRLLSFGHAYFSLFSPIGQNINKDIRSNLVPESEKAKVFQTQLVRRVEKIFVSHFMISCLLLVPYFTFIEMFVQESESESVISVFHDRVFTISVPVVLISMVLLSFISYYHQVRSAKTAAKTWSTINTSPASNVRSPLKPQRLETGLPCLTDDPPSGVTTPVTSRPCSPTPSSLSHTRPVSMMYPYSPTAPAHVSADVSRDSFPGGRRCEDDDCTTCVWLREGPNFQSTATRKKYKFMTPATCTDTCLVYLVTCTKCRKQYVGSCVADLRQKNSEHRQDIDLQRNLLGRHFASVCGYDFWSITIIDNCPRSELSRRQRFWIQELVTRFPVGLNESQDLM